jgi:RNA polymerase sigma-70 factor, ECF subfamily
VEPSSNRPVVTPGDREIGADILEACRRGDREAFRALYDAYKDKVYSIALYYFHGDESAASDVTQQVFLKLFTAIGQFRGDSGFSTWLYRLVVNTCTDAARRIKAKTVALDRPALEALSHHGAPGPEEAMARAQMADSVQSAVSALPERFRLAILLRYFEGLSYEEMAAALDCSMGTVASRLSRGHRLLAGMLASLRRKQ